MVGILDGLKYYVVYNSNLVIDTVSINATNNIDFQASETGQVLYKYILEFIGTSDFIYDEFKYGALVGRTTDETLYRMYLNIDELLEVVLDEDVKRYITSRQFNVYYDGMNHKLEVVTDAGKVTIDSE